MSPAKPKKAKSTKGRKDRPVATKGVKSEMQDSAGGGGAGIPPEGAQKRPGCLRLLGRVFLYFFGFVLLITVGMKTFSMMDDIRFKMMDAADVPARFEKMRDLGQIMDAYKLLQLRPKEEAPAIVGMLLEDIDTLEAPFLFLIAERMLEEEREEALFWVMAARLRLEYDVHRCLDAKTAMQVYPLFLRVLLGDDLHDALGDGDALRPLVQRVLDWDEEHPPAYEPGYICVLLTRSPATVGEARWPSIRYRLRKAATDYLRDTEGSIDIDEDIPAAPEPDVPQEDLQPEENAVQEEVPQEDAPQKDLPQENQPQEGPAE